MESVDFNSLINYLPDISKACTNELNFQNIELFALQGNWRYILDNIENLDFKNDKESWIKQSYHILSLFKLKEYVKAAEELTKIELSYVDNDVPYCLILIRAILPFFLEKESVSFDFLYKLIKYCKSKIKSIIKNDDWLRKWKISIWCLINEHLKRNEFLYALEWLNQLLQNDSNDQHVWFIVCCVQLLMGNLTLVELICNDKLTDEYLNSLIKGLLSFSNQDYENSIVIFEEICKKYSKPWIQWNNYGICHLYNNDLDKAISACENALSNDNISNIKEQLIKTLFTMYDLRGDVKNEQSKKIISDILKQIKPDDFNI